MSKQVYKLIVTGLIASTLLGCSLTSPVSDELSRIRDADAVGENSFSLSGLRHQALRDAALSIGARGGLAYRAKKIRQKIYLSEASLDHVFNFRGLVLDDSVVPPVLVEGRGSLEIPQDDLLRVADRQYLIIKQARFSSNPPNWRDYIQMEYSAPELPDKTLLPRTETEKNVWDKYVQEGWRAGIRQADTIFLEQLGRLKRDYQGMIRYHTLLAQNIVSKPFVARSELGITGNNEQLAINDRVLRITSKPAFNLNGEKWKPDMTPSTSLSNHGASGDDDPCVEECVG